MCQGLRQCEWRRNAFAAKLLGAALVGMLASSATAEIANRVQGTDLEPGVYRLTSGGSLFLAPLVDESGQTLQFLTPDNIEGRATKAADGSYSDQAQCPNRFVFSGRGTAVSWSSCKKRSLGYSSFATEKRDLTFKASDGRTIGATIWRRAGLRNGYGIVLAHGADEETRDMGTIVPILLQQGFAVLAFDQRGAGVSEGNWRSDGVAQIALDASQAAHLLKVLLRLGNVGFYGFSNGGWVAAAAARAYGDPAFVVIKIGDSQSIAANVEYETYTAVRATYGQAAALQARTAMSLLLAALADDTPASWRAARDALSRVHGAPWLKQTQLPSPEAIPLPDALKTVYRRELMFDPKADLLALKCPILVMLGDQDLDVEAPRSAALFRTYFKMSGNRAADVIIFSGAGHQLVMGPGLAANNSLKTGIYAEGFPRRMTEWLRRIVRSSDHAG